MIRLDNYQPSAYPVEPAKPVSSIEKKPKYLPPPKLSDPSALLGGHSEVVSKTFAESYEVSAAKIHKDRAVLTGAAVMSILHKERQSKTASPKSSPKSNSPAAKAPSPSTLNPSAAIATAVVNPALSTAAASANAVKKRILGLALEPAEKDRIAEEFCYPPKLPGEVAGPKLEDGYKWANAHDPSLREALKAMVRKVERVSFHAFDIALRTTLRSFESKFKESHGESCAILVEPNKSNLWMAEVAYKYLDEEARGDYEIIRLGEKDAKKFVSYCDGKGKTELPQNVILFDDGSYSGDQMCQHVQSILDLKKKNGYAPKIFVVIPYMTTLAMKKLFDMAQSHDKVFIAETHRIPSISDSLDPRYVKQINDLYWAEEGPSGAAKRGLYYFAHKVPNLRSFPDAIARGTITPPKKTADDSALHKDKKPAISRQSAKSTPSRRDKYSIIPNVPPPYKG